MDGGEHEFFVEGLVEPPDGAAFFGGLLLGHIHLGRKNESWCEAGQFEFAKFRHQGQAIHVRHVDIGNDEIEYVGVHDFECVDAVDRSATGDSGRRDR